MRLRSRILPQAGTVANRDGESRPAPPGPGSPTYSGEGTVSHQAAQSRTVAVQHVQSSPCSSPKSSLFSSIPSSPPSYLDIDQESISTNSPSPSPSLQLAMNVVQEATTAEITAPIQGGRRTRKKWSKDMNSFIMRHYFILSELETNTKTYLTPLHARFIEQFPEMTIGKQRVGDQRRAIVQRQFLTKQEIETIKEEVRVLLQNQPPSHTNTDNTQTRRIRWSDNLNEAIIRSYYRITKLETDLTTYRSLLHQDVTSKYPEIAHLSAQRIADQRRSIINNRLLSAEQLNRIREEVQNEIGTIITHTPEDITQHVEGSFRGFVQKTIPDGFTQEFIRKSELIFA